MRLSASAETAPCLKQTAARFRASTTSKTSALEMRVNQVLQVFIFKAGEFQGSEMAVGDKLELGRDPNCAVLLDDESCSRRHAVLFAHQGQYAVQDLGSANGTRLNGELISGPRFVTARDEIGIGAYSIKIKPMASQQAGQSLPPMAAPPPTQVLSPSAPVAVAPVHTPSAPVAVAPVHTPSAPVAVAPVHTPSAPVAVAPVHTPSAPTPIAPASSIAPATVAAASTRLPSTPGQVGPATEVPHTLEPSNPHQAAPKGLLLEQVSHALGEGPAEVATSQSSVNEAVRLPPQSIVEKASSPVAAVESLGLHFKWVPGVRDEIDAPIDDDSLAPDWSLVERLLGAKPARDVKKEAVVEVVLYRGDHVFEQKTLRAGDTFKLGAHLSKEDLQARGLKKPFTLVGFGKETGEIFVSKQVTGQVMRQGRAVDLHQLPEASSEKVPLAQGEMAQLTLAGEHVLVRMGHVPKLPNEDAFDREAARERKRSMIAGGAAILFILTGMIASWIYGYMNPEEKTIALEDDGFAEVVIEMEMEKPKPKPKRKKKAVPAKKDKPQASKPDPKPAKPVKEAPKPPGVMDALKNLPKPKAGAQSLTKALSNVRGVKTPGASGFKVSSMIGKSVKGVSIGGASGGVSTSSLNSILRKGGNGPGILKGLSSKRVKGSVKALRRASKVKGKGKLSKEEIMKVLRTLFGKIQYCYEKQLRANPGLHGKVVFEWEIKKSGRVGWVKTGNGTTLKSAKAVNCMKSKLKKAAFPRPRGNGTVIVKFPFVFNTL